MAALETAHSVIAGFNTWTPESVMAFRAPNCLHQVLPASLGRRPLNNEEYAAYFIPLMPAFRKFQLTVHDVVNDEAARKVAMHVTSTAETDIGKYKNEYMLILYMTEDGRKVQKILEYVDSSHSKDFFARL